MGKKHDLPAMPMYWGDWFKATDLQALDRNTRCTWFEMLGRMWENNERGFLSLAGKPMSDNQLANLLGYGTDIPAVQQVVNLLLTTGICSRRNDGVLYCRRMVREEEIRSRNATNGAKGGNPALISGKFVSGSVIPKTNRYSEDEIEESINSNTIPNQAIQTDTSHTRATSTDEPQDPAILAERFDTIRKAYPGAKRGNETELKTFLAHGDASETLDRLLPAIQAQKAHRKRLTAAGDFCPAWPHFATWLNNRQWELEFEKYGPQPSKETTTPVTKVAQEERPASPEEIAALVQAGIQEHKKTAGPKPQDAAAAPVPPPQQPAVEDQNPQQPEVEDQIAKLLNPYMPAFKIANLRKMVKNLSPIMILDKIELTNEEQRTDPGSFLFQAIVFNYQSKKTHKT